jgi:hypothetical protein
MNTKLGFKTAAQEKDKEIQGGAGIKKELKALKPKGYFKRKSRAPRNARSSQPGKEKDKYVNI